MPIPPPPKGYAVDPAQSLPAGYKMDGQVQQNAPVAPKLDPQQGTISSFLDSSGVTGMVKGAYNAVVHPEDTAKAVWDGTSDDAIKAKVAPYLSEAKQAYQSARGGDLSSAVGHATMAVPVVGDAVRKAATQVLNNPNTPPTGQSYMQDLRSTLSTPGAMGTLAGAAAGLTVVPKAMGAIGGAIGNYAPKIVGGAARMAGATPESAALAGSKLMAPGTVGETLVRALKPAKKFGPAGDVAASLESSLPSALVQNPKLKTVSELGSALDDAKDANAGVQSARMAQYQSGQGTAPRPTTINGTDVANAQVASIPFIREFENPGIVQDTAERALPYTGSMPIETADKLRKGANQELAGYYNKEGGNQYAAEANPETTRVKAIGDTIRNLQYPAMDADLGLAPGTIAAHQMQYGQLADAGNIANNRSLVYGRHDPVTLSEKIAVSHGGIMASALNFAKEKAIASMTNSDGLVRSAVDRVANPGGAMTSLSPRSGFIPQGLTYTGKALGDAAPQLGAAGAIAGQGEAYNAMLPPRKKGRK